MGFMYIIHLKKKKEKERWWETASGEECEKRHRGHVSGTFSIFSFSQSPFAFIAKLPTVAYVGGLNVPYGRPHLTGTATVVGKLRPQGGDHQKADHQQK